MKIRRLLLWCTGTGLVVIAGAGAFLASPYGKDARPLVAKELRPVLDSALGRDLRALAAEALGKDALAFLDDKPQTKQAAKPKVKEKKKKPPIPVVAAAATTGDIEIHLGALGTVSPLHAVTVRTRIDSQLVTVHFREGQMVRQGQLLAQIDRRPFEVQLAQAQAQMARDRALLANARLDLERYRVLLEQDSVAKQTLDTQQALVQQYEGMIAANQAAIDNARLQLVYCDIVSPVSGRAGLRHVDPGNMVRSGDPNGIVTVTQLDPISVVFSIPEDRLPVVMQKVRMGERLRVDAYDRSGRERIATGSLVTVDNQIDPTTGTVKLKAVFPNAGHRLFPNQFVNVRMLVDVQRGATLIQDAAVQRGSKGTFVYAVKPDQTVDLRPVSLGAGQDGRVAVIDGLKPDELVVIDGADRLREGADVELVKSREAQPMRKGLPEPKPGSDA